MSKLTVFKAVKIDDTEKKYSPKGSVNDEKLECNISRAKQKIFEYALCNDWEWFSTFTLDKKKYNRYDLEKFRKDFSQYIRNYNTKNNTEIKYLVIPETHKDGAWHMHGFLTGLPVEHLRQFTLKEHLPEYMLQKITAGNIIYDWTTYRDKFGWTDIEPIRNHEACAKYVTKYISKELARDVKQVGAHLYYCSHGLRTAQEIKRGLLNSEFNSPDYENDYVKVKWYKHQNTDALVDMIN